MDPGGCQASIAAIHRLASHDTRLPWDAASIDRSIDVRFRRTGVGIQGVTSAPELIGQTMRLALGAWRICRDDCKHPLPPAWEGKSAPWTLREGHE